MKKVGWKVKQMALVFTIWTDGITVHYMTVNRINKKPIPRKAVGGQEALVAQVAGVSYTCDQSSSSDRNSQTQQTGPWCH